MASTPPKTITVTRQSVDSEPPQGRSTPGAAAGPQHDRRAHETRAPSRSPIQPPGRLAGIRRIPEKDQRKTPLQAPSCRHELEFQVRISFKFQRGRRLQTGAWGCAGHS